MRTEQGAGLRLALGDDAVGGKQLVSAVDLRNIPWLETQKRLPLVARHVEPDGIAVPVAADEITDGGTH